MRGKETCKRRARCLGDHPRVCGKTSAMSSAVSSPGSPPRMRGKVQLGEIDLQDIGSPRVCEKSGPLVQIVPPADHPAYAGKRHCRPDWCARRWDHPRMRGKDPSLRSPPLAQDHPAYAGKAELGPAQLPLPGSPPRMRERRTTRTSGARYGDHPAYAGKGCGRYYVSHCEDHPRVCGESFVTRNGEALPGDHPRVCGEKFKRR